MNESKKMDLFNKPNNKNKNIFTDFKNIPSSTSDKYKHIYKNFYDDKNIENFIKKKEERKKEKIEERDRQNKIRLELNKNNKKEMINKQFNLEKNDLTKLNFKDRKKFLNGKYRIDYTIDLHFHTIDEAYRKLYNFFIKENIIQYKCISVITGRGNHTTDGRDKIKDLVPNWFKQEHFSKNIIVYGNIKKNDGELIIILK